MLIYAQKLGVWGNLTL